MPAVVDRAKSDLAQQQLWKARNRLEGYVGSQGYHAEVLELLGDVCYRMGDYPAAGRYWFFTPANRPEKHESIEAYVLQLGAKPAQILAGLPSTLRWGRWLRYPPEVRKRLEKLQQSVPIRRSRRRKKSPPQSVRNQFADMFAFGVFGAIMLFFLYCFSLGVAQLVGAF